MMSVTRQHRSIGTVRGLGLAAFLVSACAPAESADAVTEDPAGGSARVVNVEVHTVEPGPFVDYIRVAGQVEAFEDVVISADEAGALDAYLVERGDRIGVGQALVKLDSEVLEAQVDEARAAADLARQQFERRRQLWEAEGIGTEIAFLQAKSEAEISAARLANLQARLARTTLRSPLEGVLEEKYLEAGERAGVGDPVLRVVTLNPIKIVAGIPERFAPFVRSGNVARISFDVLQGRQFDGRIGFVGTTVNPDNRTFPIEVVLTNPRQSIKPQMIANVQVVREQLTDVVVIPQPAVLRGSEGYYVFVVEEGADGPVATARPVRLGPSYENRVVVEEGLEIGEVLVVTGQQLVDAGSLVRVIETAGDGTGGGR